MTLPRKSKRTRKSIDRFVPPNANNQQRTKEKGNKFKKTQKKKMPSKKTKKAIQKISSKTNLQKHLREIEKRIRKHNPSWSSQQSGLSPGSYAGTSSFNVLVPPNKNFPPLVQHQQSARYPHDGAFAAAAAHAYNANLSTDYDAGDEASTSNSGFAARRAIKHALRKKHKEKKHLMQYAYPIGHKNTGYQSPSKRHPRHRRPRRRPSLRPSSPKSDTSQQ